MGRRSRKAAAIAAAGEPTAAREALERRWQDRLVEDRRLATMVTSETAQREPLHRWIQYRQGFSPALVRLFLKENASPANSWRRRTVLDPFSGTGTTGVECARNGVRAIDMEALASLVFLAAAKWTRNFPPLPGDIEATNWQEVADRLSAPIHRAALMLAVGRQYTTGGRLNPGALPLARLLDNCAAMIREDLLQPLSVAGLPLQGDARRMDMIAEHSVDGILTSPPYLARYDYREVANPYEQVYSHWYGEGRSRSSVSPQLQASPTTASTQRGGEVPHDAVKEPCAWLMEIGHKRIANMVNRYMGDIRLVLGECARVLAPGGVLWMVIGGARLKDVYVPADLIVAELAQASGFRVHAIRAARDLIPSRRRFGRIGHVSPRESILVLYKI